MAQAAADDGGRNGTPTTNCCSSRSSKSMPTCAGVMGRRACTPNLTLGLGMVVNEKRMARLMRAAGIRGLYVRRRRGCTVRNPDAEPTGDLVNRQFG
jgi:hypothetical protein